jgi:hypothetical protein
VSNSSPGGLSAEPHSTAQDWLRRFVVGCQTSEVDDDVMREAEANGRHVAEAVDALEAWLLTEDAYERSGVPDEVLAYMQDHIDRLLGPHATLVAGDFLRQHVEDGGGLANLARDRSALLDLLALIEGKRHQGFELEWHADRPVPPDEEAYFNPDNDDTPRSL